MSKTALAKYGVTFHFAGRLLSKAHIEKAGKLYEICREADDIADNAENKTKASEKLLTEKKNLLDQSFSSPWSKKAQNLLSPRGRLALLDLLDGVISDLKLVRIKDQDELLVYCYRVAGSVGLMMCDIFEIKDKRALDYAVTLGIAMQITNICRDVQEDATIDRRYLPGDDCSDLEPTNLMNPNSTEREIIRKNVSYLLKLADDFYDFSEKGLVFLPWRARLGILVASHAYKEIGRILKYRHSCDIWKGRVITSNRRKIYVALKAILISICRPSFYFYNSSESLPLCVNKLRYSWHNDKNA
tara:strand:- start:1846 stop:2748 length:903 start_codon:yes stop_codon:yes gene_type:complete